MHKLEKKLIVIFMSLTFLTSGIITASAITIQENKVGEQKETTPLTKTVILHRHGIDGSVTPFEVNLNLEDGQDIGKVMADKCEELLENEGTPCSLFAHSKEVAELAKSVDAYRTDQ